MPLWAGSSGAAEPKANAEVVARIGEWAVNQKQMANELRYLPAPLLTNLKQDENAARNFAFEWWAAALLASDARDEGLLKRKPGLKAAADAARRSVISRVYIADLLEGKYAPTEKELEQVYDMRKDELCSTERRYRLAVAGVRWGAKASPEEITMAEKRLAEIEKRLAGGEAFAKVADELSDLPQKLPGGEIGWVTEAEMSGTEGAQEVKSLEVGGRTGVVRTETSAVTYSLLERTEAEPLPFALCKDRLRETLNAGFQRDVTMRRMDEIAEAKKASMNFDAFLAALRAAPAPEPAGSQPGRPTMPR